MSLFVFLSLLWCSVLANAQLGFLSIDCGGKVNRTDPDTNITWVTEDNFINMSVGERAESFYKDEEDYYSGSLRVLPFYLRSLRVFPKPHNKVCYELPLTQNVPHLLRLSFLDANFTGSRGFNYSVETLDMLYMEKVVFSSLAIVRFEKILFSADSVLHICLIRTSECDDPFISAIELRCLKPGMYDTAKHRIMLDLIERDNMGPDENTTRYPDDPFDRMWFPWSPSEYSVINVSETVSVSDKTNFPPTHVMQTAVIASGLIGIDLPLGESPTGDAVVFLYFAKLNSSVSGSLSVRISNQVKKETIDVNKAFFAREVNLTYEGTRGPIVSVESDGRSDHRPIINAVEMYSIVHSQKETFRDDVSAIVGVWKALSLTTVTRDPCFGLAWEGLTCRHISNTVRISEINLSGRKIKGLIPSTLGNLTELISLSLNDNDFKGRLPNLSKLAKLRTLHLQNNYLSDKIPDWFWILPHLKEVDISNNNFKGLVPQQLNKINFTFHGNKHLCQRKRECEERFPRVAVGVGGGFIAIAIVVGIIIYRTKFRSSCAKPSPLDYLMVNVANSSKTRSFTLEEMTTATESFSRKIGQGSFGSVFSGELKEGKQIAVKVLSIFSKHGIEQFLNEVELLTRINHKKLVSFLGYCNESRDLMLVYEYMSAGSLSDNLYDPDAPKYPQLMDWKTRLSIALDAAQGLEYLHVGCTPKIIHRDVKTSNILIDGNLNGKLADFGLSRVTGIGETSQINTTIKGTPGYLDPMYYKTHMLTDKSDVYSFGVVLLELICGRKPIDLKVSEEKIFLTEWVESYAAADKDYANIQEIVDKRLVKRYNEKSIAHLTNLSRKCIASAPSSRPSMGEVVAEIKEGLTFEEEYHQLPDELSLQSTTSFSSSVL